MMINSRVLVFENKSRRSLYESLSNFHNIFLFRLWHNPILQNIPNGLASVKDNCGNYIEEPIINCNAMSLIPEAKYVLDGKICWKYFPSQSRRDLN